MNAQDRRHTEELKIYARRIVRETGCVAFRAETQLREGLAAQRAENQIRLEPRVPDSLYSHIMHAYDMACALLVKLDPQDAAEFIKGTYGPSFRNTEAAR